MRRHKQVSTVDRIPYKIEILFLEERRSTRSTEHKPFIKISSKMSSEMLECVICFDEIGTKNNITTECGHKFHATCLMKNVMKNGLGCPCCRTVMMEEEESIGTSEDTDGEYDDDDDDLSYDDDDDEVEDDQLRAFRMFNNRIEGVPHDPEDELTERYEEEGYPVPTIDYLTRKLIEDGVTMNQLVACMIEYRSHGRYDTGTYTPDMNSDLWNSVTRHIIHYEDTEMAAATAQLQAINEEPVENDTTDAVVEDVLEGILDNIVYKDRVAGFSCHANTRGWNNTRT